MFVECLDNGRHFDVTVSTEHRRAVEETFDLLECVANVVQ